MSPAKTTRQLNIRVSPELIDDLDEISQTEQLDRTTVVRRLLQEAIQDWKLSYALRLYREDRITKERAAENAGAPRRRSDRAGGRSDQD